MKTVILRSLNQEVSIYSTPRLVSAFVVAKYRLAAKYKVSKYRPCSISKAFLRARIWILADKSYYFLTGILGVFRVHCSNLRHDLLLVYTGPLALLRRQHLRVGAIRLAYG